MDGQFFVKYIDDDNSSEISLPTLAKSLNGLDQLFKDLLKTTDIRGDISVKARGFEKGSFLVDLAVKHVGTLPFDNPNDLIEFLKISNAQLAKTAQNFFSVLGKGHRTVNDFLTTNPFDKDLILIAIAWLMGKASSQKKTPVLDVDGESVPKKFAEQLHKYIKQNKFKDSLSPLMEEEVKEIVFSPHKTFEKKVEINQGNFENYLSEDARILPDLHNGQEYTFNGRIVGLQVNKGDTLSIRCSGLDEKDITLVCILPEGEKASAYTEYFDKEVSVLAEVYRHSYFKKPKIILKNIQLTQLSLFD